MVKVIKYLHTFVHLHSSFARECVNSDLVLQANRLHYNFLFPQSPGKYFPSHLIHLCRELTDALVQCSHSVEQSLAAVMSAYCTAILNSVISQSAFITRKSLAGLSWDGQIYPSDFISSLHETLPSCFSFPFFPRTFDL